MVSSLINSECLTDINWMSSFPTRYMTLYYESLYPVLHLLICLEGLKFFSSAVQLNVSPITFSRMGANPIEVLGEV